MSSKSRNSSIATGSLYGMGAGATTGAAVGSVFPVIGTGIGAAVGAGAGALLGGVSGYLANDAEEEAIKNDPDYIAKKRRERSMQLMSQSLGRAFAGMKQARMGASSGLQG